MSRVGPWGILAVLAGVGCGTAPVRPAAEPQDGFDRGEALYSGSDYANAAVAYESHLAARPDDPRNDMVLLRLGLIHLKLGPSNREPERGEQFLRDLAERFPDSPLRDVSDYVLELLREARARRADVERYREAAERLESQLDALKRIDMERSDSPR